ncbi:MAG: glycosyltransferase family 2 protein, partial [Candidatus Bathyarchaeota archaeon]
MVKMVICMPVYNAGEIIKETMESILNQSFEDFEIIITDDNSTDNTFENVKKIDDPRIKYYIFKKNVGYPKNLERCINKWSNSSEILFLMGQDDILAKGTLEKVNKIFDENENVGAITRPYYWFHDDIKKPVRAKDTYDKNKDAIISI